MRAGVRGVGGELGMSARVRAFGGVLVIAVSGTGSEFERRPLQPGLPTMDIIFVERGEFEYLERGRWISSSGPLMVAPSGLPHRVRFTSEWSFVVARIPRRLLLEHVPMLADAVGVYSELTVPERSMQAFLAQAVTSDQEVSEGESRSVDRLVLEMAGALLRSRQGDAGGAGAPRTALRDRALAFISRESGDARTDPSRVAQGVGSSLRHLQAVFSDSGTTVAGEIRRERARVARSLLQDPRYDELGVEKIAERAGFGSSASMRRVLDELYGLAPKELRNARGA